MAASIEGIFEEDLRNKIIESKVLVVGAGGIGCELLKNLVLSGFKDIDVIDLDTIDVSNLNRQFLFHKIHVGKSKAEVAKESTLQFNPNVNIKHYHDSIIGTDYDVNFFKKFSLVMNALDNRIARNHVNRMCLAADVPLIESGTAGYDGQVELIKKGMTKCYECEPKAAQKAYPNCTIRNTPSEPIHCIVWAKFLFNQLFGEEDDDQEVSPDREDPELQGSAARESTDYSSSNGNIVRKSTREWAVECDYDPEKLFHKLFRDDISYLLTMTDLWTKRRKPTPLDWNQLPDAVEGSSNLSDPGLKDLKTWSIAECGKVFGESVKNLSKSCKALPEGDHLVWDKDDKNAMDFVTACANIRAYVFGIPQKSRFDIKTMAGNIIPAIATTNAIIAGVVILKAFKILQQKLDECQTVYLRQKPNPRKQLLVPERELNPPNPKCYVCSKQPTVQVLVNTNKMTVKELEENVLKKALNMAAPDAILDATGTVVISSEEGETEHNYPKTLADLGIKDGVLLKVDDFLQNYQLDVFINHYEAGHDDPEFKVAANPDELKPKAEEEVKDQDADDDCLAIDEEHKDGVMEVETLESPLKRKLQDEEKSSTPPKKRRIITVEDDGTIVL